MQTGPDFIRPGYPACPPVATEQLNAALAHSGWHLFRHNRTIDLWTH